MEKFDGLKLTIITSWFIFGIYIMVSGKTNDFNYFCIWFSFLVEAFSNWFNKLITTK